MDNVFQSQFVVMAYVKDGKSVILAIIMDWLVLVVTPIAFLSTVTSLMATFTVVPWASVITPRIVDLVAAALPSALTPMMIVQIIQTLFLRESCEVLLNDSSLPTH